MDLTKYIKYCTDIPCDIQISILDGIINFGWMPPLIYDPIIINCHKDILVANSPIVLSYFRSLFENNFSEKLDTNITIYVPNKGTVHDIIMNFYGCDVNLNKFHKHQKYLYNILCWDFLNIPYDKTVFYNTKFVNKFFDLLLDIIDKVFEYDENIIALINKNLPSNYDLSKFPDELITQMILNAKKLLICYNCDNIITIIDGKKYYHIKHLHGHTQRILAISLSPDGKYMASMSIDQIIIWSLKTLKIHQHINFQKYQVSPSFVFNKGLLFTYDSKYIVCNLVSSMEIFTVDLGNHYRTCSISPIYSICCHPLKDIIMINPKNNLSLYNYHNDTIVKIINDNKINRYTLNKWIIKWFPDGIYVAISTGYDLHIYNTETHIINTYSNNCKMDNIILYGLRDLLYCKESGYCDLITIDNNTKLNVDQFKMPFNLSLASSLKSIIKGDTNLDDVFFVSHIGSKNIISIYSSNKANQDVHTDSASYFIKQSIKSIYATKNTSIHHCNIQYGHAIDSFIYQKIIKNLSNIQLNNLKHIL